MLRATTVCTFSTSQFQKWSVAILAHVFIAPNLPPIPFAFFPMSTKRGPASSPNKPDAHKHHKGPTTAEEVTLKDLGKMMSVITKDMGSMKEDLAAIKGNTVTKGELEEFKEKQEEFIKDSVKAEVQQHLQELKARNHAFQEYIHQKMFEDVKCKAKLDGSSTTWTEATITSDPSIAEITKRTAPMWSSLGTRTEKEWEKQF